MTTWHLIAAASFTLVAIVVTLGVCAMIHEGITFLEDTYNNRKDR